MKKRILITGGAGFIGSHLCEALISRGYRVTCVDNFSTGSRDNVSHIQSVEIIEGDVNKRTVWSTLKGETFDALFHYAACVGVRRTEEYPMKVMADVGGLRNVMKFARDGGAKKILFSSSSEVYGNPTTVPTGEEDGSNAWSPYTTVKMYGEHLLRSLWEEYSIPTVSMRFFNVYGPRQAGNGYGFVTATFIRQVLQGEPPTVYGDGTQTRDFVHISDNVQAAIAALESDRANGEVLNIGTGIETQITDLAHTVIRAAGRENGLQPVYLPARTAEIMRRCASTEKMEKVLGIRCTISLEEGIRISLSEQAAAYQQHITEPELHPA